MDAVILSQSSPPSRSCNGENFDQFSSIYINDRYLGLPKSLVPIRNRRHLRRVLGSRSSVHHECFSKPKTTFHRGWCRLFPRQKNHTSVLQLDGNKWKRTANALSSLTFLFKTQYLNRPAFGPQCCAFSTSWHPNLIVC